MTSSFEHQRHSYKRNYLRNLIVLASADGRLDDAEKETLYNIGRKRGLKDWQIEELLNDTTPFEIFIPESFANRMSVLYDLMQILYADGEVNNKEIVFVKEILKAFDLPESTLEPMVELFKEGPPLAEDWSLFRIQVYNNKLLA